MLPLRDIVIFPFMIVPLYVSRDRSIKAVDQALGENRMILLAAQKKQEEEDPGPEDIYPVGTAALIMRMLKLPDGRIRVLVQGIGRARITSFEEGLPHLQARIETVTEPEVKEKGSLEVEALMRNVKAALEKSTNLGKPISPEVIVIATNMDEPGRLADLTAVEPRPQGRRARRRSWRRSSPWSACAGCTSSWPRSSRSSRCSRRSPPRPRGRWTGASASSSCASR